MSTDDVPGANPNNGDKLRVGCWAESEDSLLFVKSTEIDRVIYEMFDLSAEPVVVYTDAMNLEDFKKHFTWNRGKGSHSLRSVRWTWHDKSAFPWEKVIKRGVRDGAKVADVEEEIEQAERLKKSRTKSRKRRETETEEEDDVKVAEVVGNPDTPAGRVAKARRLEGAALDPRMHEHMVEKKVGKHGVSIWKRVQGALDAFKNPKQ